MKATGCFLLLFVGEAMAFPVPKAAQPASISGTTWSGDGVVAPTRYTFEINGTLTYSYNGNTHRNGTWTQTGNSIYWECNNKYCEFQGTLKNNEISGGAWNVTGFKKDLVIKKEPGHAANLP